MIWSSFKAAACSVSTPRGQCRPAAVRLQLWTRRNKRGEPPNARASHAAATSPAFAEPKRGLKPIFETIKASWQQAGFNRGIFWVDCIFVNIFCLAMCLSAGLGLCLRLRPQRGLRRYPLTRGLHPSRHLLERCNDYFCQSQPLICYILAARKEHGNCFNIHRGETRSKSRRSQRSAALT